MDMKEHCQWKCIQALVRFNGTLIIILSQNKLGKNIHLVKCSWNRQVLELNRDITFMTVPNYLLEAMPGILDIS